ncbi:MAG: mechanosensitive ion channel, partial [Bacteroidetes bacterium]|nr:mechanosensitive ion channel [Bacteroidota bacterium]
RVWNVADGREVCRVEHEAHYPMFLAFSPNGRQVVSGGGWYKKGDRAVRLWQLPESVWPQASAAIAEPGAFVVLGKEGVEGKFDTLAEAAPEDRLLLGSELARLGTVLAFAEVVPDTVLAADPESTPPAFIPLTPPAMTDSLRGQASRRRLQELEGLLDSAIPIQNIPGDDSLRQIKPRIRREIARQDTFVEALKRSTIDSLSVQARSERLQALGGLMRLEITLLDSAHAALKQSNTQFLDALAVASRDSALAALHQQIVRLWDVFAAVQQSNQRFAEALGEEGLVPLGDQNRDERLREFGWQVRQEIGLLDEARTALAASNTAFLDSLAEKASVDSLRQVGYQIDQGIARLQDIYAVLEQSNALLSKVQRNAGGGDLPIDSLRQIGQQIRQEAARQRRVLDALNEHDPLLSVLSEQASTEGIRELTWQMRQQIDLLDELHEALETSNTALLDGLVGDLQQYGGKLFLALLVVAFSFFLVRGLVWLLQTLSERRTARRLFFKKLIPMGRLIIWGLTIYIVLADIFKLDQRGILAAATALGVAIGFAAQDILKNIFGGILIIFDQPFQVGDKINVGGTYGEVVSIGLRSTRIVTPDDNLVSVPNAQVVDSQVANANAGALDCQVVVELYLPGWVDVKLAKSIAYSAAANSKYVYLEKPIVVNVTDVFKETFLTQLKVKAYVLDTRYEFALASDITETAKAEFLRQGLFNKMDEVPAPLEPPANGAPNAPSPLEAP